MQFAALQAFGYKSFKITSLQIIKSQCANNPAKDSETDKTISLLLISYRDPIGEGKKPETP